MKVLLIKLRVKISFKLKIILVGIINNNVESCNENHITIQNITETKHTKRRPLNIKTVSYYENKQKSSNTETKSLNTTGKYAKPIDDYCYKVRQVAPTGTPHNYDW
jgi:hypothetical protein